MKIVHLLLTSRFAGSERYAIDLANAQCDKHEVTVILHKRATEQRPDALAHRLLPAVRQVIVGGRSLWTIWQARRALRALAPDVAHGHLSLGCRSLRGLKLDGVRMATLHIHYKPQQHSDLDGLIAIAPWQLAAVPEPLRSRTRQIDNWTRPQPVQKEARETLRQRLGIGDDQFLIGALGRVENSKGMDLLISAFGSLNLPRARLAIVGAGRDWDRLRRMAPSEVIMPGFVEQPQDWFAAFDAFVSAARSEPFGFVLLEAMASGLPILATASEGAQHLRPLIGRRLVACDDEPALTDALRDLVMQRPPRQHYDLSAYDLHTKTDEIEAWYRDCLRRKGTRAR
jgi:glycosyltransferase involved in cell wall biosynthesis